MPNYKAELVGVFGHPVSENPTVVVLEAAFHALNLNWRYLTIEVLPEQLGAESRSMRIVAVDQCGRENDVGDPVGAEQHESLANRPNPFRCSGACRIGRREQSGHDGRI